MMSSAHLSRMNLTPRTTVRFHAERRRSAGLLLTIGALALLVAGCGTPHKAPSTSRSAPASRAKAPHKHPHKHPHKRPSVRSNWHQNGLASWYGGKFHGRLTASGERYNMNAQTAAHKELPFGTIVRVTNVRTGRHVDVRINDRGPFVRGRIIDLSRGAAKKLGIMEAGVERVRLEIVRPA